MSSAMTDPNGTGFTLENLIKLMTVPFTCTPAQLYKSARFSENGISSLLPTIPNTTHLVHHENVLRKY